MTSDPFALVGYVEAPSYRPGDRIEVKVSSAAAGTAHLVRLRHGDTNPDGPGLLTEPIPGVEAPFDEGLQDVHTGSWGLSSGVRIAEPLDRFTLAVWVWPTVHTAGSTLLSLEDDSTAVSIVVDDEGRIGVARRSATGSGTDYSDVFLRLRRWQLVAVSIDTVVGSAEVRLHDAGILEHERLALPGIAAPAAPVDLVLAARRDERGDPTGHYDGKLEAPRLFARAFANEDFAALVAGAVADAVWAPDLGADQRSVSAPDTAGVGAVRLFGMPTRGVTGRRWRGQVESWTEAPELYAAIHFHSDDVEDAGWATSLILELPDDLESGLYAAHLQADGVEDHVPFVVSRSEDSERAPLAVLVPTLTYLAYANEPVFEPHVPLIRTRGDDYASENSLVSQYNWHRDGSGVAFASWRRPLLNLRPDYRYWLTGFPHGLGADLYLLHWLDAQGIRYDLVTDHQLHAEGIGALVEYPVLVTGSHPEYWTVRMLEALEAYQQKGGRIAYLGGNGLAALVAVHGEKPHVSEMRRRRDSVGLWDADAGESYFASDGHLGGTTRHQPLRGRELIGLDISGMGFAEGRPYERTPDAADPRVSFLFEGVGEGSIGDFGLMMGGAAGYEVDSADKRSGTPPHALVVASCVTVPPHYVQTEQRGESRADMVFFETPAGGAVFSVGSITWTGALSHNGGDNEVATITANALRRFLDPAPFPYSRNLRGSEQA